MSRINNDSEKDTITVNSLQVKTETITGSSTVKGNETVQGNLLVLGTTSMHGNVGLDGSFGALGTATIGGNSYLNGNVFVQAANLSVGGNTTVTGDITTGTFSSLGDATVRGNSYTLLNSIGIGQQYVKDNTGNYILARAYRKPTFANAVAGVIETQLTYNFGTTYGSDGGVYLVTISSNVPDYSTAYGFFCGIVQFSSYGGGKATVNMLAVRNLQTADPGDITISDTGLLHVELTGGAPQTGQYRVTQVQIGY